MNASNKGTKKHAHRADYLLVTCIDFRLIDEVTNFMHHRGLKDKYDELIVTGVSLGIVRHPSWKKAFFSQLALIKKIHKTKTIILLDHRDCGLYKHVFGSRRLRNRIEETKLHHREMLKFKKEILTRCPNLRVELFIMSLDGQVEEIKA